VDGGSTHAGLEVVLGALHCLWAVLLGARHWLSMLLLVIICLSLLFAVHHCPLMCVIHLSVVCCLSFGVLVVWHCFILHGDVVAGLPIGEG